MAAQRPIWHYEKDGKQFGPVHHSCLISLIKNGTITTDTLVLRNGMPQWAPAGATPGLARHFVKALGLNGDGLMVFIILLLMCLPLCWLPWVISSLRADG